ncbi:hypothetical protein BAY61_14430 [Prauserella marina]|uniref:Uncharacterized protein n=1 Tax=Prauserella marina TaxID=530584 RepID=A0A222VQ17_9PSEU|nr:DUF6194 family protein [Prauserella marina]ASR36000.1 hypothetical protein BAY61_14430 [Prauserella marina]PWV84054.1 hypothetical protein DES30_10171 [Prauserella marina]SDC31573.1 hypothetical protein SAMN05421630_1011266 [Prauserella marina]
MNDAWKGPDAARRYIAATLPGVVAENGEGDSAGDTFFSFCPDGVLRKDRWTPFATIVTGDTYDSVSGLSEEGAYRLNIGLPKAVYTGRFGAPPAERDAEGVLDTGWDYSVRDAVMPHPHYASQYWVCVVNPGPETWADIRELLDEAYRFAERKHANTVARQAASEAGD